MKKIYLKKIIRLNIYSNFISIHDNNNDNDNDSPKRITDEESPLLFMKIFFFLFKTFYTFYYFESYLLFLVSGLVHDQPSNQHFTE